jgi:uncharacterized protein (DUF2164 family)
MTIKLQKASEKDLLSAIQRFYSERMDDEIDDLKAMLLLDFVLREIGPSIYNQAIADAQSYFQEKVDDLSGARYVPEFDYWKK